MSRRTAGTWRTCQALCDTGGQQTAAHENDLRRRCWPPQAHYWKSTSSSSSGVSTSSPARHQVPILHTEAVPGRIWHGFTQRPRCPRSRRRTRVCVLVPRGPGKSSTMLHASSGTGHTDATATSSSPNHDPGPPATQGTVPARTTHVKTTRPRCVFRHHRQSRRGLSPHLTCPNRKVEMTEPPTPRKLLADYRIGFM
jgi:hypothetical protein